MLDVAEIAVGSEWAEAAGVVWAGGATEVGGGWDVEVGAVVAVGADAVTGKFLAFAFVAEVEGVCELAGFGFLAEAALVVLADLGEGVRDWTGSALYLDGM